MEALKKDGKSLSANQPILSPLGESTTNSRLSLAFFGFFLSTTILAMKGAGHDYDVIQKFIGNISKGNLRTKAKRARALLADCLGRKQK